MSYLNTQLKTNEFTFDYATITAQGKPTQAIQGVANGFSLPVYNSDNEELFGCHCVPLDWDGNAITLVVGGWLYTANTDKNFNLQVSYECWNPADNDVVPSAVTDMPIETATVTDAQYTSFKILFPIASPPCESGDIFAIRIRRIAASENEIAGEFVVQGAAILYGADRKNAK